MESRSLLHDTTDEQDKHAVTTILTVVTTANHRHIRRHGHAFVSGLVLSASALAKLVMG